MQCMQPWGSGKNPELAADRKSLIGERALAAVSSYRWGAEVAFVPLAGRGAAGPTGSDTWFDRPFDQYDVVW